MKMIDKNCADFVSVLSTKAPVPGGGGASALCGAIGTALGNMVGSLTVGKKKYRDVEPRIIELQKKCDILQDRLLGLIDRDAEVFAPLAAAYSMPKDTEDQKAEKDRVMEKALLSACEVPLEIMKTCASAIDLIAEFAEKGSRLAVSDAGCGAILCGAALQAASLNVFINTKAMKNRERADKFNAEADALLKKYVTESRTIYATVAESLR